MDIRIEKAGGGERIHVSRADGSEASSYLPSKWWAPHDAVHFYVERALGFQGGFWGLVADGHHPDAINAMAKEAGHASAKRAEVPATHFVEAIQAERIVEAFEADQWSGAKGSAADISSMAQSGCDQSLVPGVSISDAQVAAVRAGLADFGERWAALPVGGSLELRWGEPSA